MGAGCLACTVRSDCESFVSREGIISGFSGRARTAHRSPEESSRGGASLHDHCQAVCGGDIREVAEANGVCVRPVVHEVTDTETGQVRLVPTPCGATLASKCAPCAQKNRVLRMQQCREGWHLEEEPVSGSPDGPDEGATRRTSRDRRVRSTRAVRTPRTSRGSRWRSAPSAPPSPRRPGRPTGPRCSSTFTLPSYGAVRSDGTPQTPQPMTIGGRPSTPPLPQARRPGLAEPPPSHRLPGAVLRSGRSPTTVGTPLHAADRGAIPRELLRAGCCATYHQVWWPDHAHRRTSERPLPEWERGLGFVDPDTRESAA